MFFMPQGVQYDLFAAPDLFLFFLVDTIGIGNIGELPKAEAQHGHFEMPDLDRLYMDITYDKGVFIDPVQTDIRDTGVFHVGKSIREFPYNGFLGHFIRVNIHRLTLEEIIGPYVVQSGQMIFMGMGKEYGIQLFYVRPEHLVAEIRRRVDYNAGGSRLYEDAGAKPFVPLIRGGTYFTGAGDHGNAGTGACAKKRDL